jgi:hypothetical protein
MLAFTYEKRAKHKYQPIKHAIANHVYLFNNLSLPLLTNLLTSFPLFDGVSDFKQIKETI